MHIRIDYRTIQKSQMLEDHVRHELKKLENIIEKDAAPASIDIELDQEGHSENLHEVRLHALLPLGDFTIKENNPDIYIAISRAMDKLIDEIRQAQDRAISKRDRPDENQNPLRAKKESFEK